MLTWSLVGGRFWRGVALRDGRRNCSLSSKWKVETKREKGAEGNPSLSLQDTYLLIDPLLFFVCVENKDNAVAFAALLFAVYSATIT